MSVNPYKMNGSYKGTNGRYCEDRKSALWHSAPNPKSLIPKDRLTTRGMIVPSSYVQMGDSHDGIKAFG